MLNNYAFADVVMRLKAKVLDVGCRVTAERSGSGLRAGDRNESLRRLTRYSFLGAAIALAPMTQALADVEIGAQFIPLQVSTVPGNGDTNPYGVVFVPPNFSGGGLLQPGDVLVSNFNNAGGLQGTGTTIVKVTPAGQVSLFFNGNPNNNPPPTLGLTTALGVLKRGFVLVGNMPTTDGTFSTIQAGSLLVINSHGQQINTISDPVFLDGPWDLTILDGGDWAKVFVSNVRNGTVTRLDLLVGANNVFVVQKVQIASGYMTHKDPAALIVGPTGLAYDVGADLLYVASTADNEIFAVPHAGTANHSMGPGTVIYQDNAHLRGPLALAFAPNGHLLTSNGDAPTVTPPSTQSLNSEIVEFTKEGKFIAEFSIDSANGAAFGIAVSPLAVVLTRFAPVDDATNEVTVFTFPSVSVAVNRP